MSLFIRDSNPSSAAVALFGRSDDPETKPILIVPSAPVFVGGTRAATCDCFGGFFAAGGGGTADFARAGSTAFAFGVAIFGGGGAVGFGGGGVLTRLVLGTGGGAFLDTAFGGGGGGAFLDTAFGGGGGAFLDTAFGVGGGGAFLVIAFGIGGALRGAGFNVGLTIFGAVGRAGTGGLITGACIAGARVGGRGTGSADTRFGGTFGATNFLVTGRLFVNPAGRDNVDFGFADGGGNNLPETAGATGAARPARSNPGKVGIGPSFSRTLRSTITLGRLDPGG